MKVFKYVIQYCKKRKRQFIAFGIFSFLVWGCSVLSPYILGKYIDKLVDIEVINTIFMFTCTLFIINFSKNIIGYLSDLISTRLINEIAFDVKLDIFKHLKKVPINYFKDKESVYLSERINKDADEVVTFYFRNLFKLILEFFTVILGFFYLYFLNHLISYILIIIFPIYLILYRIFKNPMYNNQLEFKENSNVYYACVNIQFSKIQYIKLNVLFEYVDKLIINAFSKAYNSLIKYFKISYIFTNLEMFFIEIINIIILFYGGVLVYKQEISIGSFVIINSYCAMIIEAIKFFIEFGATYQQTMVSFNRIIEIKNINNETNGTSTINSIKCIRGCNLCIEIAENKILKNINIIFNEDQISLIKGKNGVGKTTLINVIAGLYIDNYKGLIYYDDLEIHDIDMYKFREKNISFVEQEPSFLSGSIYDNIFKDNESKDIPKELKNLMTAFGLEKFSNNNYKRLFEEIRENTNNLSGGEKQKISLIKAILENKKILILDEPSSALDKRSIEQLKTILLEIKQSKIIIIISHDDRLIDIAEQVIELT